MTKRQQLVSRAIRLITMTVETLAERLDLSTSALRRYRQGTRGVTPALLTDLGKAMRRQGQALEAMAVACTPSPPGKATPATCSSPQS